MSHEWKVLWKDWWALLTKSLWKLRIKWALSLWVPLFNLLWRKEPWVTYNVCHKSSSPNHHHALWEQKGDEHTDTPGLWRHVYTPCRWGMMSFTGSLHLYEAFSKRSHIHTSKPYISFPYLKGLCSGYVHPEICIFAFTKQAHGMIQLTKERKLCFN